MQTDKDDKHKVEATEREREGARLRLNGVSFKICCILYGAFSCNISTVQSNLVESSNSKDFLSIPFVEIY